VYSQKQTSVITIRSGTASLTARTAVWTIPRGEYASLPSGSFFAGMPKRRMAGMFSWRTSRASLTSWSTERVNTPGIEGTSRRRFLPGATNSG